jgi:S-adenosylmethionine/arginine decarboxylase-like enzyme
MTLNHKHLIMNLAVSYPPKSADEVEAFLSFVIHRINMKIAKADSLVKNPHAYYCKNAGNIGVTGSGILETSHTALHTWEEDAPMKFHFDLYSCSDFELLDIINLCKTFGIIRGSYMVIDRNEDLRVIEAGVLGKDGIREDVTSERTKA